MVEESHKWHAVCIRTWWARLYSDGAVVSRVWWSVLYDKTLCTTALVWRPRELDLLEPSLLAHCDEIELSGRGRVSRVDTMTLNNGIYQGVYRYSVGRLGMVLIHFYQSQQRWKILCWESEKRNIAQGNQAMHGEQTL
jgi:hypothetical protein